MSYPQTSSPPRNDLANQRGVRDWTRDVAVNVLANLLAAAIIWLLASATGYVKGNATLTAIAAVIVVSVSFIALTEFASRVHRRVDAASMSGLRFNLLRSSPAILIYLLLTVAVPSIILDMPSGLNSAWREIPYWLRFCLLIALTGLASLAGFLRAWMLDRKGELEDENEESLPPLPIFLRIVPAASIAIVVGSIATIFKFGMHWPWNY
ncbi:hypothetical protein OG836_05945 [Micromonospora zamorensis]|uniref:hypothetical protein n=1 Tax=Micromonospora zamorensis TaxID=709883 RepID=UPI002E1F89BD